MESTAAVTPPADAAAVQKARAEELRRRGLFAYHDGYRDRLADLVEVQMRIQDAIPGGDMAVLEDLLTIIAGPDEPASIPTDGAAAPTAPTSPRLSIPAATVRLAKLVAAGFDLPPLDEATAQGLSIQERVDLLSDFLATAPADEEDEAEENLDDDPAEETSAGTGEQPIGA